MDVLLEGWWIEADCETKVSILIVMDVLLEVIYHQQSKTWFHVSILIVMDVLLEVIYLVQHIAVGSFNPYCNGCTSRSINKWEYNPELEVSILIVMDVLLEDKQCCCIDPNCSFNPYCNGCTSRRSSKL